MAGSKKIRRVCFPIKAWFSRRDILVIHSVINLPLSCVRERGVEGEGCDPHRSSQQPSPFPFRGDRSFYPLVFSLLLALILCTCGGKGMEPELEPRANHAEGDLVIELPGGVKMAFIWIEPGTFMMGSDETFGIVGWGNLSRPVHQVMISQGFYLGKYELTQRQWLSLMDSTPWGNLKGIGDDHPAAYMARSDMETFFDRLNAQFQTTKFRLPTEAEWEYACRAGTTTIWSFEDARLLQDHAWYDWNADGQAQPVGQKLPNPWGLYDMHGNIGEWVLDGMRSYSAEPQVDPVGPEPQWISQNIYYVHRGGSWLNRFFSTSSAGRLTNGTHWGTHIGFRILREGPKEP